MFTQSFSHLRSTMLVAAIFATATVTAHAATSQPPQRAVRYTNADLADSRSAMALYRRIQRAAQAVCEPHTRADGSSQRNYEVCYQAALADAVSKVDHPALTTLHDRQEARSVRIAARANSNGRG